MSEQTVIASVSVFARFADAAAIVAETIDLVRRGAYFSACDSFAAIFCIEMPNSARDCATRTHSTLMDLFENAEPDDL